MFCGYNYLAVVGIARIFDVGSYPKFPFLLISSRLPKKLQLQGCLSTHPMEADVSIVFNESGPLAKSTT